MIISNQGFLDVGQSSTLSIGRDFGPVLTIRSGGAIDVRGNVSLTAGDLNGLRLESGGLLRQSGGSIVTTGFDRAGTYDFREGLFAVERGVFNNNNAALNLGGLSDVQFELRNGASTSLLTGVNVGSTNTTFAREFNVLSGSTLTTSGNSSIGQLGSGSILRVSGSGSTWNSSGLISVGDATGTLIVENSGLLNMNGNSLLTGVTGASSNGTVLIQSGGQVNSGNVDLARVAGSISNAIVTGSGSQLNATGLFVGGSLGSNGGTASLTIADGASVTVDGTTRVRSAGTLNLNGGSLATQNFTRDTTGTFNFGGGTLSVLGGIYSNTTGTLTVAGSTATNNPTLVLEGSANTSGITALNVGSSNRMGTVTLNAGSQLTTGAATIASRGTLNLNGGTLSLSSFANSGDFHWSKGTVDYTASETLDSNTLTGLLGSSHRLIDNQTLASSAGTLSLGSSLAVDGGTLRPSNLINNSTMTINSGNVLVGSTFTNNASRIVQVNGTSNLSAAAVINNSGAIQLTSSTASLSGGAFANNIGGTLTGTGTVYNDVDNSGTIRVSSSEHLVLTGATNRNIGNINLSGGTLEITSSLFNRDGAAITGRGTFVGSSASPGGVGLTNDGLLSFSSGNTDIYGDVDQTRNGRIVTSGGGVTTFFDDVVHNGAEIRTFAGSRTVFLGSETGAGNFTGTGTVEFAGDLRPGNSPAVVSFEGNVLFNSSSNLFIELGGLTAGQFDQFQIGGDLTLDGRLSVGFLNGFTEPPTTWSKSYREQMATNIQMTKATIADQRGDWEASRRILTQLKAKEPLDARIELGLGRAAFQLGAQAEAESHFVAAAKLDHELVPELIMASLYDSKGETKQVELWLGKGEQPNYPFANRVRLEHARWLIRQAKPILARETVLKGSPEKDQKFEFDFLFAIADQMEGKHEEAERTLTRLHQENPSNPLISNHLAWSLVESSDEGKRGRALQIVTSNAKNSLDTIAALAWVQFRLGDVKAAANTTAIALKQGGKLSRDSAFFLGKICEAVGGETEASRLLNAARTSKGEFINAYRLK